jgi:hypothetical protein
MNALSKRIWTVALVLAISFALKANAQPDGEDPCAFDGSIDEYLTAVSARVSDEFNAALAEPAPKVDPDETIDEVANRASGDGLIGGRLDLIQKAFVALDLGDITKEDDGLVFNFNPQQDALGMFSPRVIIHQPALLPALAKHVEGLADEAARAARKKALEDSLDELDDVELRLRWVPASETPRNRVVELMPAAQAAMDAAWTETVSQRAGNLAEDTAAAGAAIKASLSTGPVATSKPELTLVSPMSEVCKSSPATVDVIRSAAETIRAQGRPLLSELRSSLEKQGFFALADRLDEDPRIVAEGSYRDRSGATGPDQTSLSLRFETGVKQLGRMMSGAADEESIAISSDPHRDPRKRHLPDLALSAEYSRTDRFELAIPEDATPFAVDVAKSLTSKLVLSWYLDSARQRRIALEASYDDVSDDAAKQDRFVGTLSWVGRVSPKLADALGGSDLVVSFVYANKPEFRGEVDKDFGMRAGLKWSFGPKAGG